MTRATPRHPYPEAATSPGCAPPRPVAAGAALRQPDRPAQALPLPPDQPSSGRPQTSLLLVDLQHFREINDRFGIRVADRLLSQVARRLQRLAPPSPCSAGSRRMTSPCCCRAPLSLDAWSRNLQQELMTPYRVEEHGSRDPGVPRHRPWQDQDAERLLKATPEAAPGPGASASSSTVPCSTRTDAKLKRRQLIAAQLPLAIKSAELTAVYQPIICTHSNRLHGGLSCSAAGPIPNSA